MSRPRTPSFFETRGRRASSSDKAISVKTDNTPSYQITSTIEKSSDNTPANTPPMTKDTTATTSADDSNTNQNLTSKKPG